ncbi:MAG: hypothetical protein Q9185_006060 [Variospora sp. 1 TL-2023]
MAFMVEKMLKIDQDQRATAVHCREKLEEKSFSEKDGDPRSKALGTQITQGSSEESIVFTGASTETASMLDLADCVSPGFYSLTPDATQVNPSQRTETRTNQYYHQHALGNTRGFAQVLASTPEFVRPSLLNKRPQRLCTAGSFSDVSAGRSKRSRVIVASEASGRLPKPSEPAFFRRIAELSEPPEKRNPVRYDTVPQPLGQGTEPFVMGHCWANDGLETTKDIAGHASRSTGLPKQLRRASASSHPSMEVIPREIERVSPERRVQDNVRNIRAV